MRARIAATGKYTTLVLGCLAALIPLVVMVLTAFKFNKVGLASAMAVILLVIILIVTWAQRRLVPDESVDLT